MHRLGLALLSCALVLGGCSVTKHTVRNAPPTFPDMTGALKSEFGTMEPLTMLSAFFWPETKNGRPLSIEERKQIVAITNKLGAQMDVVTDEQVALGKEICQAKRRMLDGECMQFDSSVVENPPPPFDGEVCSAPWITAWKSAEEFKDNRELIEKLQQCHQIVEQGLKGEGRQNQLSQDKEKITMEILQAIETENTGSNFMMTSASDSVLQLQVNEKGDLEPRIKLVFTNPDIIYDSNPNDERGLITNITYDRKLHVLRFAMREKMEGQETGRLYLMEASRVVTTKDPDIVRYMGKVRYVEADGVTKIREGRFKIEGSWQ